MSEQSLELHKVILYGKTGINCHNFLDETLRYPSCYEKKLLKDITLTGVINKPSSSTVCYVAGLLVVRQADSVQNRAECCW